MALAGYAKATHVPEDRVPEMWACGRTAGYAPPEHPPALWLPSAISRRGRACLRLRTSGRTGHSRLGGTKAPGYLDAEGGHNRGSDSLDRRVDLPVLRVAGPLTEGAARSPQQAVAAVERRPSRGVKVGTHPTGSRRNAWGSAQKERGASLRACPVKWQVPRFLPASACASW